MPKNKKIAPTNRKFAIELLPKRIQEWNVVKRQDIWNRFSWYRVQQLLDFTKRLKTSHKSRMGK